MSYCVHCGVELSDSEKSCPLCDTPVIDIHRKSNGEPLLVDKPAPKKENLNKSFIASVVTLILLIPFAITTLLDVIFSLGLSWAAFVFFAEACIWVYFVLPFNTDFHPIVYCLFDTVVTVIYLLIISLIIGGFEWYFPLALPITLMVGLTALIIVHIFTSKKHRLLTSFGWSLVPIAFLPAGIDISIHLKTAGSFAPVWSLYVSIPLLILGITVVILSKSKKFVLWIRKKMFI